MGNHGKFSPERLMRIRRLRKARRYFKQIPLFAFHKMQEEFSGYSYEDFLDDLRRRSPVKKKKGKSQLVRYGRYNRMCKLLMDYKFSHNPESAIQAQKLRQRLTQPYRILVRIEKQCIEYSFSAFIPIERIEKLVSQLANVSSEQQADNIITNFRKWELVD